MLPLERPTPTAMKSFSVVVAASAELCPLELEQEHVGATL